MTEAADSTTQVRECANPGFTEWLNNLVSGIHVNKDKSKRHVPVKNYFWAVIKGFLWTIIWLIIFFEGKVDHFFGIRFRKKRLSDISDWLLWIFFIRNISCKPRFLDS